jgi:antitoxin CptB
MMDRASKIAKLKWQCRRGMLELDLALQGFVEKRLNSLTEKELTSLEILLNTADPILYEWLMGRSSPEDKELSSLVEYIRSAHTHL